MRRSPKLVVASLLALATSACSPGSAARPTTEAGGPASVVRAGFLRDLDTLVAAVERLDASVAAPTGDAATPRRAFEDARRAYKRVEYLVEYHSPTTARGINGPALDDMKEDDPNRVVIAPEGFQVVEEYLYPEPGVAAEREGLRTETRILLANVRRARLTAHETPLTDAVVLDAARLELTRVLTLGLAGFDSPVALRALPEAAEAVAAIGAALRPYADSLRRADPAGADSLAARLARTERTLRAATDFDGFDRLAFLTADAEPLGAALLAAQRALRIPLPEFPRAWRPGAPSVFAPGAFDPMFFARAGDGPATPAQVALGWALFFDPVLSRDGARSCATCHVPERGFADGRARSVAVASTGMPTRNAPTVLNSALQGATFADLRTTFLEDQVADVVGNAAEMHGSLEGATAAVAARPHYQAAFAAAYPARESNAVSSARVRAVVAAYLRSLIALDAPFDRHVRGDTGAMTVAARRGFTVFMGKGKCGTCHFAPLFNGTVPPLYDDTESEVIGVPARAAVRAAPPDPDRGRALVTRLPIHEHAFKTPTLRNVALTSPYMHNGAYRTLEEVVDFYDRGGGAGVGFALPNQTLPPDPLRLTPREKRDLVAFMRALTDTAGVTARAPARVIAGIAR